MHISMSFQGNETVKLWQNFRPRLKEVLNQVGDSVYSLQVYPGGYFQNFNASTFFEKWALTEVSDYNYIPDGMRPFTLPGGLYAVFNYKGPSGSPQPFQYIFGEWLPQSAYLLDDRPHFEILGQRYDRHSPSSEEEIWIPVKLK